MSSTTPLRERQIVADARTSTPKGKTGGRHHLLAALGSSDEEEEDVTSDFTSSILESLEETTTNVTLDTEEELHESVVCDRRRSQLLTGGETVDDTDDEEVEDTEDEEVEDTEDDREPEDDEEDVSYASDVISSPVGKRRKVDEAREDSPGVSSTDDLYSSEDEEEDAMPLPTTETSMREDGTLIAVTLYEIDVFPLKPSSYKRAHDMFKTALHHKPIVKRLYAGQMTDGRELDARSKIEGFLKYLNRTASVAPREGTEVRDPPYLTMPLLPHQRHSLAWMLWREAQVVGSGGILADEMGLGKTFSIIALVVAQRTNEGGGREEKNVVKARNEMMESNELLKSRGTLIVAPATLVHQWEAEINKFVKPDVLNILIYHGSNRPPASEVRRFGMVITTFDTMRGECALLPAELVGDDDDEVMLDDKENNKKKKGKKERPRTRSTLLSIAWRRVVLDEAHHIKNHTSARAVAASHLIAQSRWCLTGTPVHNRLRDFFSYVRFLRVSPFDELAVWKQRIESSTGGATSKQKAERLKMLVSVLLLRREKTQTSKTTGKEMVSLPAKNVEVRPLSFSPVERGAYQEFANNGRAKVERMIEAGERGDGQKGDLFLMLVLIMRLRQFAVHPSLVNKVIDLDTLVDGIDMAGVDADRLMREGVDADRLMREVDQQIEGANKDEVKALFNPSTPSAKLSALIGLLSEIVQKGDEKVLVVSQWTSVLDLVALHIAEQLDGVEVARIDGKMNLVERQQSVSSFNGRGGPRVLLLSITAGGCGLNLVGGNHVVLMDLHWNPQVENQAYDRVHRMGQTKEVHITKFFIEESIEARVMELQKEKEELAKAVLDGTRARAVQKLSLKDIKFLFNIVPTAPPKNNKPPTAPPAQI